MSQQRPNREQRGHSQRAPDPQGVQARVQARYIKSSFSRLVHADGIFGGPTPVGMLYMAFFSEHAKVPESVRFVLDAEARTLRPVPEPAQNPEWVREIDGEVILSLDVARSLRDWLTGKITLMEKIVASGRISVSEQQDTDEKQL